MVCVVGLKEFSIIHDYDNDCLFSRLMLLVIPNQTHLLESHQSVVRINPLFNRLVGVAWCHKINCYLIRWTIDNPYLNRL
jgi:hypothetical protein